MSVVELGLISFKGTDARGLSEGSPKNGLFPLSDGAAGYSVMLFLSSL
jgi:hypothetical protein